MDDPLWDAEAVEAMWKKQDRHALSIGNLCMTWAALDRILDDLFEPLLQCSSAQVASIITNLENVSARCDILKRLLVNEAPSEAYREWLTALLDRVSGELSPLRNRYVHDHWTVNNLEIVRTDKRAQIGKAQSRQPLTLRFDTRHVTDPKDVDNLTHRITLVLAMLAFAENDLRIWRHRGQPLEPHPEYIAASKPRARYTTRQEDEEAARQGRPPSPFAFD